MFKFKSLLMQKADLEKYFDLGEKEKFF